MNGQTGRNKVSLQSRLQKPGPRKLLAIDGGGIRGVLALEILKGIEQILRSASGNPDYRLADYFDYVAGTSTGGIVAAGIAVGMSIDEILDFYEESGADMFQKARLHRRLRYRYESEPLAEKLKGVFGADTTLGSPHIESLVLLVMRNATTDSPWPISNNPFAKYNDPARADCNLQLPLWQLVRASTAAPTYFPPEVIVLQMDAKAQPIEFVFVDGGVTMYNNPAFQLFLMATVDRYWPGAPDGRKGWETGIDKMLIVSVGTGTSPGAHQQLNPDDMNVLFNASTIPSALMFAALNEQDFLCRTFGQCVAGDLLDREVDTMIGSEGPLKQKLFRYVRYNAELTVPGLQALGCEDILPASVQKLDAVGAISDLRRVGQAVARHGVQEAHLDLGVFRP